MDLGKILLNKLQTLNCDCRIPHPTCLSIRDNLK